MLVFIGEHQILRVLTDDVSKRSVVTSGDDSISYYEACGTDILSAAVITAVSDRLKFLTETFLMQKHYGPGIPDWSSKLTPEVVHQIFNDPNSCLILAISMPPPETPSTAGEESPTSDSSSLLHENGWVIAGSVLAVTFTSLTGTRGRLEDLVVDPVFSGCNWGKKLVHSVLNFCESRGCNDVQLTCAPKRVRAHHVYKECGFEERHSVLYNHYFN